MAMCNDRGILHYWWAICQSSGAVWGLIFREESFSLHWPPSRRQREAKLTFYPFPKNISCQSGLHLYRWMFHSPCSCLAGVHLNRIYDFAKEHFQFYISQYVCLCRLQTSCITFQIKGNRVIKCINPPSPSVPFMSLHVVLLKPAWTESVKLVQNVNNVLEIQISELAALNERLACLLTQMAKWLIPDCEESVKQGFIECSAATGYTQV